MPHAAHNSADTTDALRRVGIDALFVPERLKGFHPLKPGRIHLKCPTCGRKMSNTERCEDDPAAAVLIETECPECADGHFDDPAWFGADGEQIMWHDD